MKATSMAASTAAALSLLQSRDPTGFEKLFQHVTPSSLTKIQDCLDDALDSSYFKEIPTIRAEDRENCRDEIIAEAMLRRLVYMCLDKYKQISTPEMVERALKHHMLPKSLQDELVERFGGEPPATWFDALQRLEFIADSDGAETSLWEMLLDHPMTAYVPMQCQACGHVVPDDLKSGLTDEQVGLEEVEPTFDEAPMVRSGWFRGPRPEPKVFVLTCPDCGATSRWFRSRDPQVILNPHKWGRLCGEQEDLRLDLANYLGINIRTCLPLDWDHVWSEYSHNVAEDATAHEWTVQDDSARNFAVRLDEGIGSWTGVLAMHPNPSLCEDVTAQYLSSQSDGGRADNSFVHEIPRYAENVAKARNDASGTMTQAGTVVGYAIQRAGLDGACVTEKIRKAAKDYGTRPWYDFEADSAS
jgi:hypothetical protein